jgi:hypothetical protein
LTLFKAKAILSKCNYLRQEIGGLRAEMNARFTAIDQRFMWLYGLLVVVLLGVAGLWFK